MLELSLLRDLNAELPHVVRLQRLLSSIRISFHCHAVGLLKLDGDCLQPVAIEGLSLETLGRRFVIAQHPRLAAILAQQEPVRFLPEIALPDPYDGLMADQPGTPLPVHDCMGVRLEVEGQVWGVLTLDAFEQRMFKDDDISRLNSFALLAASVVRMSRLEDEVRALRLTRIDERLGLPNNNFELVGQNPNWLAMLHELDVAAASDLPILLLGETGTGKELLARRVHQGSARYHQPLVHINCAALPESLAEDEFFGHIKGAFSGAQAERLGRFEAADGGTLLLDEVGELPLTLQAKLLRTLQNGELQRLGEDIPRKVDVRIIAATNRNLLDAVRSGRFRADLYHRMSVYPVHVLPLRERGNDIFLIAGRFLEINRARLGLRGLRLSAEAEHALLSYSWPGNVRELEHVISRAAIRALSGGAVPSELITLEPRLLRLDDDAPEFASKTSHEVVSHPIKTIPVQLSWRDATANFERQLLESRLAQNNGNWAQTARSLGIDASNLHKLATRLGMKKS